jgi:hypothetical protein
MTTKRPWTQHVRRALVAPGNLIAGAGAVLASAVTWNPLPLILYGLGEPVWLYAATTSGRYARELREQRWSEVHDGSRRDLVSREQRLAYLITATPCGRWIGHGQLPDYAAGYQRLVAMRDQAANIVWCRHDAANVLEHDIVARLDDMLRAYLMIASERLVLHCALAKIYPQLPEPAVAAPPASLWDRATRALIAPAEPAPVVPWLVDTRFVSLADAEREVRDKLAGFARDIERDPAHDEVYRPMIEVLERRLGELAARRTNDLAMAAQLGVLPDQMEIIVAKLATRPADVGEVIADVKLLLEQTDDTMRFAEDTRLAERHTLDPRSR